MPLPLVSFEDVKRKRKGLVDFHPITLGELPPVALKTFFGAQKPDVDMLATSIRVALTTSIGGALERAACYYTVQPTPRFRVFAYVAPRHVVAVEAAVTPSLQAWLTAMTEGLARGSHGCLWTLETNGCSTSMLIPADEQELEEAPIKIFARWAPTTFKREDLAAQKAALLAGAIPRKGPSATDDPGRVAALLHTLAVQRGCTLTAASLDVAPDLAALERAIGESLPTGLTTMWRSAVGPRVLFFGYDLFSPGHALREHARWQQIFDEMTLDDLTEVEADESLTQRLYCCPKWVPFVDLVGGNYVAIDLLPGPKGQCGQVIVAGRNTNPHCIAPDLTAFLELCVASSVGEPAAVAALATVFPALGDEVDGVGRAGASR